LSIPASMRDGDLLTVVHDTAKFKSGSTVVYRAAEDSHRIFLVADPRDDFNREWVMSYSVATPATAEKILSDLEARQKFHRLMLILSKPS